MTAARICRACGQPLPEPEKRRDPPLAPLERPDIVTIHDLPPAVREKAQVEKGAYGEGRLVHYPGMPPPPRPRGRSRGRMNTGDPTA